MSNILIYTKLADIMKEVDPISKGKTNQQQGYKFRGIDDLYNALHSLFSKHEVFITSEVLESKREERTTKNGGTLIYSIVKVKFTLFTTDGSSVSSIIEGEAMDNGDKATNKALSVALKYCLMQMFLIPTEELKEMDPDNNSPEPMPKKQDQRPTISPEYDDARPWLNSGPNLNKAMEYLRTGKGSIEEIEKKYRLNKEVRANLQLIIDTLNK
jgi:hypothetical protein